ncbi:MAG: hypothetical protein M3209_13835 [Acidobacteriota bacterium]|nr:hypothetical protein [Acidobacteriota bacterium]
MAENQENKTSQSGDPGSTPGSAEGDRETVEQDLEEKGLDKKDEESEAA